VTQPAARVAPSDVLGVATSGLRARRLRSALSVVGIAIGIATIVAVVAIPASSKAELLVDLAREGNLLTVQAGHTLDGAAAPLPRPALGMIRRIPPVLHAAAVGVITGASVRRSAAIPAVDTGGIAVVAADPTLLGTLDGTLLHGAFLNAAIAHYPAVVLGNAAAQSLGIPDLAFPTQVDIGGHNFTVVGILNRTPLTPEIDQSVLVGFPIANSLLGFDDSATEIYVRAEADQVVDVQRVLAATANPESPEGTQVSHPSDILAARAAARGAFNNLLLALGAIALLVGGIGIANVMIISVLERRSEIGLRRALGATRAAIASQFVAESVILSLLGGALGVVLGVWVTTIYARVEQVMLRIPIAGTLGILAAAIGVGAVAGIYPATRAARLSPTDALRAN